MDLDIAKNLSQLQAKKLAIETGTDLTGHCDTWIGLNDRILNLMEDVEVLRVELDRRFGFMELQLNQLRPPYQKLLVADKSQELVFGLSELNKICMRLETNPNLARSEDCNQLCIKSLTRITTSGNEENIDLDGDDKSTLLIVSGLLNGFEDAYRPLQRILEMRTDLPYANYAKNVRDLRESISKMQTLKSKK